MTSDRDPTTDPAPAAGPHPRVARLIEHATGAFDPSVAGHLAGCAYCRSEVEGYARNWARVNAAPAPAAPPARAAPWLKWSLAAGVLVAVVGVGARNLWFRPDTPARIEMAQNHPASAEWLAEWLDGGGGIAVNSAAPIRLRAEGGILRPELTPGGGVRVLAGRGAIPGPLVEFAFLGADRKPMLRGFVVLSRAGPNERWYGSRQLDPAVLQERLAAPCDELRFTFVGVDGLEESDLPLVADAAAGPDERRSLGEWVRAKGTALGPGLSAGLSQIAGG